MKYNDFKNDMVALYNNGSMVSIAVGKLIAMIVVEHLWDQGNVFQILDDNDTSMIFIEDSITAIDKSNDGLGDVYTVVQDGIQFIISVI